MNSGEVELAVNVRVNGDEHGLEVRVDSDGDALCDIEPVSSDWLVAEARGDDDNEDRVM